MKKKRWWAIAACLAGLLGLGLRIGHAQPGSLPVHPPVATPRGGVVVQLCDGKTSITVKGVRPGQALSPRQAREVTSRLMDQRKKQTSKWTDRDMKLWAAEQKRVVDEGKRIFHDATAVGGTIGISCDMCHPNAANTHAETYPKFQPQLKRVAALRDMINWCIENPVKGTRLAADDPKMLALEAYITSQREGVLLKPGKH